MTSCRMWRLFSRRWGGAPRLEARKTKRDAPSRALGLWPAHCISMRDGKAAGPTADGSGLPIRGQRRLEKEAATQA